MEGDTLVQAKGKRRAEAASPTREHHDQSTSIATGSDLKRLKVGYQGKSSTRTVREKRC